VEHGLIDKYLGGESVLPEQTSSEFLESLLNGDDGQTETLSKVRRVVGSYRPGRYCR